MLPIFPGPSADWRWPLIALATTGLLYGSYLAFRQPDSRGVIAYSSIGQMGLIVLGIFVLNDQGATGAAFAMVNHALLSAALFLLAGWVERTVGTGDFRLLGGLARGRPVLATICIIVGVCALAVPGSATFASEFLILLGAFQAAWWLGTIASLAIVLAAMYMLRWISAILHDREGVAVGEHRPRELAPGRLPGHRAARARHPRAVGVAVRAHGAGRPDDDDPHAERRAGGRRAMSGLLLPLLAEGDAIEAPTLQWSAIAPELVLLGCAAAAPAGHAASCAAATSATSPTSSASAPSSARRSRSS